MSLSFTLEDASFDGELGAQLDTDPLLVGQPQSGKLKQAVTDLKTVVAEQGTASVKVTAKDGSTSVEITAGPGSGTVPAAVTAPAASVAPPASPEEIARSGKTGPVVFGTTGPIDPTEPPAPLPEPAADQPPQEPTDPTETAPVGETVWTSPEVAPAEQPPA